MMIPNRDANGDPIYKGKVTQPSFVYDQRAFTFITADLGSVDARKHDGNAWTDFTFKLYNASDVEVTAEGDEGTVTKTVLDWELLTDFDLIGGSVEALAVPVAYANDAKLWTVAVPDLTQAQGGSIGMIDGRVLRLDSVIHADGRGVKTLSYNATYHTNKMRTLIRHAAGSKLTVELVFEIFYAR